MSFSSLIWDCLSHFKKGFLSVWPFISSGRLFQRETPDFRFAPSTKAVVAVGICNLSIFLKIGSCNSLCIWKCDLNMGILGSFRHLHTMLRTLASYRSLIFIRRAQQFIYAMIRLLVNNNLINLFITICNLFMLSYTTRTIHFNANATEQYKHA